jgi:CRISPR-associated protein Csc3
MNHPQNLVLLYRKFYRANKDYNPSARKSIQPVYDGLEIICRSDKAMRNLEMLVDAVAGNVAKLMRQIHGGNTAGAAGKFVLGSQEKEREAILDFAKYLVEDVFYGTFKGDIGRLDGKQRGFIEDTCEFLYRVEQDKENKAKKQALVL